MILTKQRGFISASCLILLLICLGCALSLGRGLNAAVSASRHTMEVLHGELAFESNLIRLDQGKQFIPWLQGTIHLTFSQNETGYCLRLMDGSRIMEEQCSSDGDL